MPRVVGAFVRAVRWWRIRSCSSWIRGVSWPGIAFGTRNMPRLQRDAPRRIVTTPIGERSRTRARATVYMATPAARITLACLDASMIGRKMAGERVALSDGTDLCRVAPPSSCSDLPTWLVPAHVPLRCCSHCYVPVVVTMLRTACRSGPVARRLSCRDVVFRGSCQWRDERSYSSPQPCAVLSVVLLRTPLCHAGGIYPYMWIGRSLQAAGCVPASLVACVKGRG